LTHKVRACFEEEAGWKVPARNIDKLSRALSVGSPRWFAMNAGMRMLIRARSSRNAEQCPSSGMTLCMYKEIDA
jgi:hypothetical protein